MQRKFHYSQVYHIYNRGNNSMNLFVEDVDFQKFIDLYRIYIKPISDTYAWCLMKNHFHFLVQIKEEEKIGYINPKLKYESNLEEKWRVFPNAENSAMIKPVPDKQFMHLMSTYAKYFNKKHERTGHVFEKSPERTHIEDNDHLLQTLKYIMKNPLKHNVVKKLENYKWSSYYELMHKENDILDSSIIENHFQTFEQILED